MAANYEVYANIFKAIAEPTRLKIVDMLSCGELCACVIHEKFDITQPTLSHHMKVLCDSGIVVPRKEGKWTHYSLNDARLHELHEFIETLTVKNKDCICND